MGRLILAILIAFLVSDVWGQPVFKKTRYALEDGLSHNTVMNMTMDSRGFLWIATMDGLNRFDGLEIKEYRPVSSDSNSISDNFIHGIHEHENGNLWISTRDGGLNVFDPVTEKFALFSSGINNSANFPDRQISMLWKDSKEYYWLSFFSSSLGILDSSNTYHKANIVDLNTGEAKTSSNSIIEFNDGSMLMSSFNGMYYLSVEEVERFRNNLTGDEELKARAVPFSASDPFPNSSNMRVDSNGDLWLNLVSSGLQKMNRRFVPNFLKESIASGVSGNSAKSLVVERDGYLISGYTGNQLLFVNLETGEQTLEVFDRGNELNSATYIYEDLNAELWAHTWGSGFYKLEQQTGIELINNAVRPGTFETNFMLGFEQDKSGFWIGTSAGVYFYDEKSDEIIPLNERLGNQKVYGVWAMQRDDLGLWIVANEKGLVFLSDEELSKERGIKEQRFTAENSFILSKNLHAILRDSRGWLWLGYEGEGIQILKNPEEIIKGEIPEIETLKNSGAGEGTGFLSNNIRRFYEDHDNDMWVATNDAGFVRIKIQEASIGQTQNFNHNPNDENSIPYNDGRSIYQQNDSTYWFATYGGGIARWNVNQNQFQRFTTESGLPNNSTYSVVAGLNNRYIWTSTNSGLARLDTETNQFETFTETDGLQNNEFNTGAFLSLDAGRLLFGGINGLNIISPEKLESNPNPPSVFITRVELFDEELETDTAAIFKKSIRLPYNQNFLSFRFAALDFENPKQNEFAYKMEGVDQDWVYSGNRNFAGYPNLQPGEYMFKVKASNNDGAWNEEGASIAITITPPWWNTVWFRSLSVVIFIGGLIYSVRYFSQRKLRERIRKMEVENKLRNERERISRDLHDHVGSQLANIMSGLSLVDKYNQVDNKEKSSSLMNSLRGDAEVTIKQLRETIWALNQNSLTLEQFKDHLQSYFNNQTSFKENLNIQYQVTDSEQTKLSSTQALNIFRIIQEASQNTLKYAGAENLFISFKRKNGSLKVVVKDDGSFKGNQSSFNGGYGFGNMKKRAEELNGEIEVKTGEGTAIMVNIPV